MCHCANWDSLVSAAVRSLQVILLIWGGGYTAVVLLQCVFLLVAHGGNVRCWNNHCAVFTTQHAITGTAWSGALWCSDTVQCNSFLSQLSSLILYNYNAGEKTALLLLPYFVVQILVAQKAWLKGWRLYFDSDKKKIRMRSLWFHLNYKKYNATRCICHLCLFTFM